MIFGKIKSGIENLIGGVNDGLVLSGYYGKAKELLLLSDKQLDELGLSRDLLEIGANAYPWHEEAVSAIPNNVTSLESKEMDSHDSNMSETPKAA